MAVTSLHWPHVRGAMAVASWQRSHGAVASWQTPHGGGLMADAPWQWPHGRGLVVGIIAMATWQRPHGRLHDRHHGRPHDGDLLDPWLWGSCPMAVVVS